MTDLRTRLADALREHRNCPWSHVKDESETWEDHVVDMLLSLDGIAIVELPKQPSVAAIQAVVNKYDPEWAARFAADLLAAANTAEEGP